MHGKLAFSENEAVVKFIFEHGIKILNLCHIPEDGKLKTLSFSSADKDRVSEILEFGERVDGSSLFSFIEPAKSDIYIMPEIDRVFMNPFATLPTMNIMCNYLDENGKPLSIAPKTVLVRAERKLRASTGVELKALAELEYYVISKPQGEMLFQGPVDKNYHESSPFAKFEDLRSEILAILHMVGIPTKYGHTEVGRVYGNDNTLLEQHEIEFMPKDLAEMADTVAIAKWVTRNVCLRHGVSVTFLPKISMDHAGNGMHTHLCGLREGRNIVLKSDGTMSNEGMQVIGGILKFAPSLAAFGNPTPVSYLRFIAHNESPMQICWSVRNRLALIRVPLWWNFKHKKTRSKNCRETFEYRGPDAFANPYLLFAGLALSAEYGLENSKQALKIARDLYVEASDESERKLLPLPMSCSESAENLVRDRQFYEYDEVFPSRLIDKTVEKLRSYKDNEFGKKLMEKPDGIEETIKNFIHYS